MSIYIKGMKMPKGGMIIAIYKLQGEFYASANGTELYPLIEIQPHGRLIDADALANVASRRMGVINIGHIDDAPTIIEAEGQE